MVKYIVKIDTDDINVLQRAYNETIIAKDNMQFVLSLENASTKMVDDCYQKQIDASTHYDELKSAAEQKYIMDGLFRKHQYSWSIDFTTGDMTVEVYCDCGIKVVEESGIEFTEA